MFRHGIAEDFEAGSPRPDAERQLTKKGRKQIKRVAKGLRRALGKVDSIATSPYIRAVQTAEILRKEFSKKHEPVLEQIEALGSSASAQSVSQWLAGKEPGCTVMLVGHEPDLSNLLAHITGDGKSYAKLGKAGACLIDCPPVGGAPRGKLLWLATPEIFERLGD